MLKLLYNFYSVPTTMSFLEALASLPMDIINYSKNPVGFMKNAMKPGTMLAKAFSGSAIPFASTLGSLVGGAIDKKPIGKLATNLGIGAAGDVLSLATPFVKNIPVSPLIKTATDIAKPVTDVATKVANPVTSSGMFNNVSKAFSNAGSYGADVLGKASDTIGKQAGRGADTIGKIPGVTPAASFVKNTYTNPNSTAYKIAYPLTGAVIGAGVGAAVNRKQPWMGALSGGMIGGQLGGGVGASMSKPFSNPTSSLSQFTNNIPAQDFNARAYSANPDADFKNALLQLGTPRQTAPTPLLRARNTRVINPMRTMINSTMRMPTSQRPPRPSLFDVIGDMFNAKEAQNAVRKGYKTFGDDSGSTFGM